MPHGFHSDAFGEGDEGDQRGAKNIGPGGGEAGDALAFGQGQWGELGEQGADFSDGNE